MSTHTSWVLLICYSVQCCRVYFRIYFNADESSPGISTRESTAPAPHRKVQNQVVLISIDSDEVFEKGDRFLGRMQIRELFVGLESEYAAGITFCGAIIPVVVILPVNLSGIAFFRWAAIMTLRL